MRVLQAQENSNDIEVLDKAWSNPETFLYLAKKSTVSYQWITSALAAIPSQFHVDHFMLLTSGSTGQPKLVVARKDRAETIVKVIDERQAAGEAVEAVVALPLTYCYSFVNQWLWARVYRKAIRYTRGLSDAKLLQDILLDSNRAMLCLVGSQVDMLKKSLGSDLVFPGVNILNFAGGAFPQRHMESIRVLFPNARILNNYGCSEAMPRLTIRGSDESGDGRNVGRPLKDIRMMVDDSERIHFQSPYSVVAYVDSDGLTCISENTWLPSGDLGELLPDGTLRLKGRANEVFKRHGEKVSLPNLLGTVYSVWKGQAAFYRETETGGEDGHVLVLCPGPVDEEFRAILRCFRKEYGRAHWPLRIESVPEIPFLDNGKVDVLNLSGNPDKKIHWYQRV